MGETELRGSTTYSALGPPHVAWDLTLKPTGLDITSPVATSTIALTDGNYLSPQPGPDQSAPTRRELTIKGTDTSPGASVVTMGRVSGRIASDGTWSIQVPVPGPGKTVLSVRDNVGATADEQVTLIDLVITTPTEGATLPITTAPAMPRLGAVAGVQGYPGQRFGRHFQLGAQRARRVQRPVRPQPERVVRAMVRLQRHRSFGDYHRPLPVGGRLYGD